MSSPQRKDQEIAYTVRCLAQIINSKSSNKNDERLKYLLEELCSQNVSLKFNILGRSICKICKSPINDSNSFTFSCSCYQSVHSLCLKQQFQNSPNNFLNCSECNPKISESLENENNFRKNEIAKETNILDDEEKINEDEEYDKKENNVLFEKFESQCFDKAEEIQNLDGIKSDELEKDIQVLLNNFEEKKLILILVGETSSGKLPLSTK